MRSLENKVAIVTASAGAGIGQACLRRLAEEGAAVVVSDAHERRTQEMGEALRKEGYRVLPLPCDVTSRQQVEEMVRRTLEEFGRIDILVNNAGINKLSLLHEMDDETWDLVMNVNLKGAFYCSRAVLPTMIKQKYGKIVNLSSIVAWVSSEEGEVPYITAKAGIIGFTRGLAREVVKHGININCIMPGLIPNPFIRRIYPEEAMRKMESHIPMGKGGEPEDIANAVRFLVSEESRYITGCALAVTGGWLMY